MMKPTCVHTHFGPIGITKYLHLCMRFWALRLCPAKSAYFVLFEWSKWPINDQESHFISQKIVLLPQTLSKNRIDFVIFYGFKSTWFHYSRG